MPPPTLYPVKKLIAITPEIAQAIEDYRFDNRLKTEAEAIRRLIEAGLGKARPGAPSGGVDPSGWRKPRSTGKAAAPRAPKTPAPKAAPTSKLEQIRALREHGAR